jgi:hypothetical protein
MMFRFFGDDMDWGDFDFDFGPDMEFYFFEKDSGPSGGRGGRWY